MPTGQDVQSFERLKRAEENGQHPEAPQRYGWLKNQMPSFSSFSTSMNLGVP
jgi:hypothetical protein